MAIEAAQLDILIKTDTTQAEAGLKHMEEGTKSAGEGAQGFLGHMLAIAGGVGAVELARAGFEHLTDFVKDSVKAGQQAQLTEAQTAQVLLSTHDASGQTAAGIEDLATKYSKLTGFSADTIQSTENLLLTFTNIRGQAFEPATVATLNLAQAMGEDTKSAAIQLGKALGDPAKGYAQLQRVGVTFTQSQIDAIKSMQAAGNMAGAQAIILKELQTEFGGSAEAAGKTFAGQLMILQNQLELTKEKIGAALIPVMSQLMALLLPLAEAFAGKLVAAVQAFGQWITTTATWITGTVVPAWQRLHTAITPLTALLHVAAGYVQELAGFLAGQLTGGLRSAAGGFGGLNGILGPVRSVLAALAPVLASVNGFLFNVVQGVEAGIGPFASLHGVLQQVGGFIAGALQQALANLRTVFATVWSVVQQVWPSIQQLGGAFLSLLPLLLQVGSFIGPSGLIGHGFMALLPAIMQLIPPLAAVAAQVGTVLAGALRTLLPMVLGLATQLIGLLAPAFVQIAHAVTPLIPVIGQVLTTIIKALVPIVQQLVATLIGALVPVLKALIPVFVQVVEIIAQVVGAILPILIPVIQLLASIIQHVVLPAITLLLGILVNVITIIARVDGAILGFIANIGTNWTNFWTGVRTIVANVWNAILGFLGGVWGQIASSVATFIGGVRNTLQAGWNAIVGAVSGAINTVIGWFTTAYNHSYVFKALVDLIVGYFTNLWHTLTSIGSAIVGALSAAWNAVSSAARAAWSLIVTVVTTDINTVRNIVTTIAGAIGAVLSAAWNAIKATATNAWQGFVNIITNIVGSVSGAVGKVVNAVKSPFANALSFLSQIGHDIVQGLINGITGMIGAVGTAIGNVAGSIKNGITSVLGIHSPSTVFAEYGQQLAAGLTQGFAGANPAEGVKAALSDLTGGTLGSLGLTVNGAARGALLPGGVGSGGGVAAAGGASGGGSGQVLQSTFIINLDGHTIAQNTLQHAPGLVRIGTGVKKW